ncbi:T. brucei spp.-specific protein [Trypanosoma brucei gambiense DAL972]|uniref:T. brucei spp.-specific protein n=1 Tax=Trypanosoma brucei gambiense (strain MHOM/CI/86/DAL972) TaxID=679716 RepID=D0A190_TRYB9|nr:T. brucei spp.-specific protein [Trypanosoma brucei gambiense DAL972]CBH15032.1 T. brucei spp.-specific protein [Trypanosoma brucei gambiense DAL972]|eukprot:XP_011777298.1 T. brucei spp.-specific protein [Trypanosoma brucei gambiense DAL972]
MYETGRVATRGKRQREERRRVPLLWVSVPSCVIMVSLRCDFLNIPVGGCDSDMALRDCCSAALLGSFIPSAFALGAIRGNRRRVSGTSVSFKCGFLPPPPISLPSAHHGCPVNPAFPRRYLGNTE